MSLKKAIELSNKLRESTTKQLKSHLKVKTERSAKEESDRKVVGIEPSTRIIVSGGTVKHLRGAKLRNLSARLWTCSVLTGISSFKLMVFDLRCNLKMRYIYSLMFAQRFLPFLCDKRSGSEEFVASCVSRHLTVFKGLVDIDVGSAASPIHGPLWAFNNSGELAYRWRNMPFLLIFVEL